MTVVYTQIPSSIDDADLGRLGYNKQCSRNFIKNLDHCQADQSSTEHEEVRNRSAPKRKSPDTLLLTECIFCGKKSVTMILS